MFLVAMGSHADDIVGDYFDTGDWGPPDEEPEPELDLPALPPHDESVA
jgi:hypothetical protein